MVALTTKVHAHIDIQRTKRTISRKLFFLIIIGMDYCTGSSIPLRIIPYNSKTTNTIKIEILETEIMNIQSAMFCI